MTLPADASFAFCRFTQLGLLRLLTARVVMNDEVMTSRKHRLPTTDGSRIRVSHSSTSPRKSRLAFGR
jgi:hypothetical protein